MFKIKAGYCLELLVPETMKLFGTTKNKINKDKSGENIPHLEITIILSTMIINEIQESCIHLLLINRFVNYYIFHLKILYY